MSHIDVLPVNEVCNLRCSYCYEAGYAPPVAYDFTKIEGMLRELKEPFTLFGGEPLLTNRGRLEELWQLGIELHGCNGVQTNGTLITQEIVALFKRYRVHVGFSIDGPGVLNEARCDQAFTDRANENLLELVRREIPVGVILTLTSANASEDRRARLVLWAKELDALKIKQVRVHVAQRTRGGERWQASEDEVVLTLQALHEAQKDFHHTRFDLFSDALNLQRGHDGHATCIWQACDPKHTQSVTAVLADGSIQGCQRVLRGPKALRPTFERQISLAERPQEEGGCRGCRFFILCKGQCPATAINGDVTRRSADCGVWKALLTWAEDALREVHETPLSRCMDLPELQAMMLEDWHAGQDTRISFVVDRLARRRARNGRPAGYSHTDTGT